MNFLSSEKHVLETFRELAAFIEVHIVEYGLSKCDLYFSSVNGVMLPGKVCTTDTSAHKTT